MLANADTKNIINDSSEINTYFCEEIVGYNGKNGLWLNNGYA